MPSRPLLLALFCVTARLSAADAVPAAETAAIDALIGQLVEAGFPDAQTGRLLVGDLRVRAGSGPQGEEPLLPADASTMQETRDGGIAYHFTFPGLHLQAADGTWLLGLRYRFAPRPTDAVDETGATALDPSGLTAAAAQAHPFSAAVDAATWLAPTAGPDRPLIIAAMDRLVPVSHHLRIPPDQWPLAAVLLRRAGWADAPFAAVTIADQRARSFWQLRPWAGPAFAFDPTGAYPQAAAEEQAWKAAHPTLALEAPAVALRRALFRVCRAQILLDHPALSPEVAAACAVACCDPGDPQGNAAQIDALLAASRLPVTPSADADLVTRLQSWEGRPRQPRMSVSSGAGGASMTTSFAAPAPAYVPVADDSEALIALLDDERPSRWSDFSGPRSVGDNAWRALAILLGKDPRAAAGHPVDRPWTAEERRAAAAAVRAWWQREGRAQVSATTTGP